MSAPPQIRPPPCRCIFRRTCRRKQGGALPIVFLTAFEDPWARPEALKHGAVAFLMKPVDEEVLFAAIREAGARN